LSGSPISAIKTKVPHNVTSEGCGWEKNLYEKTSIKNKKTGSVICKGTLEICPVSLVGQWIDEARSKLKEPGLIYPYHGQNRKRNPSILAANSIVVTTYDVLASDAFHHAKKARLNYCPPLEQIRWWRIICDEGRSLRESNTRRSKAVLSLVADHKWIVSGTYSND
jgi:SWI/SNF-related matrix-associated actin-dependent regulator of chromatin subfamily A3